MIDWHRAYKDVLLVNFMLLEFYMNRNLLNLSRKTIIMDVLITIDVSYMKDWSK
jgi:hypothetical protein